MKKFKILVLTVGILLFSLSNVQATCSGRCYELYCGPNGDHGYCTDYIFDRLNVRQHGDATQWNGNISADQVQPNDVAIFDFGTYGHVAVTDSVNGNQITISEWNWGDDVVDPECGRTNNYHKVTTRTISKSTVTRFWRPNLSDDSQPVEVKIRQVGNYGWYPPNKTCINAEKWFKVQDGKAIQEFQNNGICWSIDPIAYGVWYSVVFGENDLPEACIQQ